MAGVGGFVTREAAAKVIPRKGSPRLTEWRNEVRGRGKLERLDLTRNQREARRIVPQRKEFSLLHRHMPGEVDAEEEPAAEYPGDAPAPIVEHRLFDAENEIGFLAFLGDGEIVRPRQRDAGALERRR